MQDTLKSDFFFALSKPAKEQPKFLIDNMRSRKKVCLGVVQCAEIMRGYKDFKSSTLACFAAIQLLLCGARMQSILENLGARHNSDEAVHCSGCRSRLTDVLHARTQNRIMNVVTMLPPVSKKLMY